MTQILIGLFDLIGSLIDSLLPTLGDSGVTQVSDAVVFFVQLISAADYLFPVTTLFQVIGIVITYKLFVMGVWVANWIIRTLRG